MGIIADLVVSVRADTTQFQKDLKTKLGAASKGASAPVSGGGGGKGGLTAGSLIGGGAALMGIYGIMKKVVAPIIQSSKFMGLFFDYVRNTIGTAVDVLIFSILAGFHILSPIVEPLVTLGTAFVNKMIPRLTELLDFTKGIFNDNINQISTLLQTVVGGALNSMLVLFDAFSPIFKTIMKVISDNLPFLTSLFDVFFKVQDSIFKIQGALLGAIFEILGSVVSAIATGLTPILWLIEGYLNLISPGIDLIVKGIGYVADFFTGFQDFQTQLFVGVYNAIAGHVPFLRKIEQHTSISSQADSEMAEVAYKSQFGQLLKKFRDMDVKKGLYEKALELESLGFSWAEIFKTLRDEIMARGGEKKAERHGLEYSGTGGLVIPQDYWGNAYDGVGTGSWM